jgi:zinc protease
VRFSSRLNLNLREDKGYTYGASSMFAYGRRLGFWAAGAGVQTQFTRETLLEFRKEVEQIREERMITEDELEVAKTNLIRGFAQRFETLGRLVDQVVDVVSFDLPLEDIQEYPQSVAHVSLEQARKAARRYLTPDNAVAVIVGDLKQIEQPIRDLNLGEVSDHERTRRTSSIANAPWNREGPMAFALAGLVQVLPKAFHPSLINLLARLSSSELIGSDHR